MPGPTIRFAIIGLDHNHAYNHIRMLQNAGAEFASCYSDKPELIAVFKERYPDVPVASTMDAILEDHSIHVIAGAAMPAERAGISIQAMRHGKDVLTDKPVGTTSREIDEIERVQRETERLWSLYSNEHHDRRCTVRAAELVADGAIGRVIQTTGIGPHLIRKEIRAPWFFDPSLSGGILGDIGAHQIEQFLCFTGSTEAEITLAQTGNFANSDYPLFEDYGEVALRGNGGIGWFRVDWHMPASLGVPGDIRLVVLGTEGYIETRKYADPAGRPGAEHLLLVNKDGGRFLDIGSVALKFGPRFLDDVRNRTETAIPQSRSFLTARLAMQAQQTAKRLRADTPPVRQGDFAHGPAPVA
jgi:predicted dehydrogenase